MWHWGNSLNTVAPVFLIIMSITQISSKVKYTLKMLRKTLWYRVSSRDASHFFTLPIFIQSWFQLFIFTLAFVQTAVHWWKSHTSLQIKCSMLWLCLLSSQHLKTSRFTWNIFYSPWRFQTEFFPLYTQQTKIYLTPECTNPSPRGF